jgi:hypothetical protein
LLPLEEEGRLNDLPLREDFGDHLNRCYEGTWKNAILGVQ